MTIPELGKITSIVNSGVPRIEIAVCESTNVDAPVYKKLILSAYPNDANKYNVGDAVLIYKTGTPRPAMTMSMIGYLQPDNSFVENYHLDNSSIKLVRAANDPTAYNNLIKNNPLISSRIKQAKGETKIPKKSVSSNLITTNQSSNTTDESNPFSGKTELLTIKPTNGSGKGDNSSSILRNSGPLSATDISPTIIPVAYPDMERLYKKANYFRLGYAVFSVAPTRIRVDKESSMISIPQLRSAGTAKKGRGHFITRVDIEIVISNEKEIFEELVPLLRMIRRTPFLPVINYLLNVNYDIDALTIAQASVSTTPGMPNQVQLNLICFEFNWKHFLPNELGLSECFCWPLFKMWCEYDHRTKDQQVKGLTGGYPNWTVVNNEPVPMNGDFRISIPSRDSLYQMDSYIKRNGSVRVMSIDAQFAKEWSDSRGYVFNRENPYPSKSIHEKKYLDLFSKYGYSINGIDASSFLHIMTNPGVSEDITPNNPDFTFYPLRLEDNSSGYSSFYGLQKTSGLFTNLAPLKQYNANKTNNYTYQTDFEQTEALVFRPQSLAAARYLINIPNVKVTYGRPVIRLVAGPLGTPSPMCVNNSQFLDPDPNAGGETIAGFKNAIEEGTADLSQYWFILNLRDNNTIRTLESIAKLDPQINDQSVTNSTGDKNSSGITGNIIPDINFVPYPINWHIESIQGSYSNLITDIQTQGEETPAHQYIGSMDSTFSVSATIIGENEIAKIKHLFSEVEDLAKMYAGNVYSLTPFAGYMKIENEMFNLLGVDHVIPLSLTMDTIPGFPGLYQVEMHFIEFDPTQQDREKLNRLEDPSWYNGNTEELRASDFRVHSINSNRLNAKLRTLELYPDMHLPTIYDVNNWIDLIHRAAAEGEAVIKNSPEFKSMAKWEWGSEYISTDMIKVLDQLEVADTNPTGIAFQNLKSIISATGKFLMGTAVAKDSTQLDAVIENMIEDSIRRFADPDFYCIPGTNWPELIDNTLSATAGAPTALVGSLVGDIGVHRQPDSNNKEFINEKRINNGQWGKYYVPDDKNDPKFVDPINTQIDNALKDLPPILAAMEGFDSSSNSSNPNQTVEQTIPSTTNNSETYSPPTSIQKLSNDEIKALISTPNNPTSTTQSTITSSGNSYAPNSNIKNILLNYINKQESNKSVSSNEKNQIASSIIEEANNFGLDPTLLAALIKTESNFNPTDSNSKSSAKGLAQTIDSTSKALGISNPFDIKQSVYAGAKYLRQSLDKASGNITMGLAAYNQGSAILDSVWQKNHPNNLANGLAYARKVLTAQKELGGSDGIVGTVTNSNSIQPQYSMPDSGETLRNSPTAEEQFPGMFNDIKLYSKYGRLVRAFPTYLVLLVDGGSWIRWYRFYDHFYGMNAVTSISVNTPAPRYNPVQTAVVTFSNMHGTLSNELADQERLLGANTVHKWGWGDILSSIGFILHPQDDPAIQKRWNQMVNSLMLKPGSRLHIRLGYGSDGSQLPVAFNGRISEVPANEGEVQVIALGDGIELQNRLSPIAKSQGKAVWSENYGILGQGSDPRDIMLKLFTTPESMISAWTAGGFLSKNAYGIQNFGSFRQRFLVHDAGEIGLNVYNTGDYLNNYCNQSEPFWNWLNFLKITFYDRGQALIGVQLEDATPFKIIEICRSVVPDYEASVVPFEFRSSLFYGAPWFPYFYKYRPENILSLPTNTTTRSGPYGYTPGKGYTNSYQNNSPVIEKGWTDFWNSNGITFPNDYFSIWEHKPFQQIHILTSFGNIIDNQISASDSDVVNKVVATSVYNGWFTKDRDYKSRVFQADHNILPELRKLEIYNSGLYTTSMQRLEEAMRNFKEANKIPGMNLQSIAQALAAIVPFGILDNTTTNKDLDQAAVTRLVDGMRNMYQGQLILFGEPGLKPRDIMFICDTVQRIDGPAEVRSVTHHLSLETGFVSTVEVDACVAAAVSARMATWLSVVRTGSQLAMGLGLKYLATRIINDVDVWKTIQVILERLKLIPLSERAKNEALITKTIKALEKADTIPDFDNRRKAITKALIDLTDQLPEFSEDATVKEMISTIKDLDYLDTLSDESFDLSKFVKDSKSAISDWSKEALTALKDGEKVGARVASLTVKGEAAAKTLSKLKNLRILKTLGEAAFPLVIADTAADMINRYLAAEHACCMMPLKRAGKEFSAGVLGHMGLVKGDPIGFWDEKIMLATNYSYAQRHGNIFWQGLSFLSFMFRLHGPQALDDTDPSFKYSDCATPWGRNNFEWTPQEYRKFVLDNTADISNAGDGVGDGTTTTQTLPSKVGNIPTASIGNLQEWGSNTKYLLQPAVISALEDIKNYDADVYKTLAESITRGYYGKTNTESRDTHVEGYAVDFSFRHSFWTKDLAERVYKYLSPNFAVAFRTANPSIDPGISTPHIHIALLGHSNSASVLRQTTQPGKTTEDRIDYLVKIGVIH